MAAVLNLSNEVVKMRAEVKRVKVLIIRKLTRQIMILKKKKGTEADLARNQRRAARLHEEIHQLKTLAPDIVTKAALQSDISFEKVCQNKDASLLERATARIATHPEFSKRIQSIKDSIEAFKVERMSVDGTEKEKKKESGHVEQERESVRHGEDEESSEDDDDDDDDDEDRCSQKVQTADKEKLKEPTKKDLVTAKETSTETGGTPAEVMRMRKEVKKLRVVVIRNLTQQIANLKKIKSEESELKGNVACVARLQEEVQVLRTLLPDKVTTRALEGSIAVEKVLQDPESSVIERVTARIATHPRFQKKLQDVRQAIEEETVKAVKAGEEKKDVCEMWKDEDSDGDVEEEEEETSGDIDDDNTDECDDSDEQVNETHPTLKIIPSSDIGKPPKDTMLASPMAKPKVVEIEKPVRSPTKPKSSFKTTVKADQSLPPKSTEAAPLMGRVSKPDTKKLSTRKNQEESDLSDSDEEKEYFDDSTEERFHKQSSYSEQSDDDDFFLGKVSRLKKKKSDTTSRREKTVDPVKAGDKVANTTLQFKMQSVFCSTLSKSSNSSQRSKPSGPKPARFQNQNDEKPSWMKNRGSERERRPPGFKNQVPGSRESAQQKRPGGNKTGEPSFERKNTAIYKTGQRSHQALHPSWEASRKRKEQQSQITAFQGKKIKFDDDDDDDV